MHVESQLTWPQSHGAWFYSERAAFEGGASRYLAEGVRAHKRALFVAEDPGVRRWPENLLDEGVLVLHALDDFYGPLLAGNVDGQRAVFKRAVDEALDGGFTGIRVTADDTRVAADNLELWIEWESVADAFLAENPVTALCAFDRSRLSPDVIHAMTLAHPLAVGES